MLGLEVHGQEGILRPDDLAWLAARRWVEIHPNELEHQLQQVLRADDFYDK